jgi:hypothetical protein
VVAANNEETQLFNSKGADKNAEEAVRRQGHMPMHSIYPGGSCSLFTVAETEGLNLTKFVRNMYCWPSPKK